MEYCVITDHTGQLQIANALRGARLSNHIKAIRKANDKISGFTILAGAETNITEQGELDIDSSALKKLDFVVGHL